jgi:DNA-binding helix-hairpin-helix protein with protein kinase domain
LFPQYFSAQEAAARAFDLSAALAAIDRVTGPGPAPDLASLMSPPIGLKPSPEVRSIKRTRMVGAFAIAGLCILLMANGVGIAAVGLAFAVYLFRGGGEGAGQLQAAARRAEDHWNLVRAEWQAEASSDRFEQKRINLKRLADEYRQLPAAERAKLGDLERQKCELQLRKHLEAHLIARARIPKIGDTRKAALASYGIENAWDITRQKVRSVPGFGEELTNKLLNWRHSVERRFVFNPSQGTDPVAIRRVKDEIARQRAQLEQALLRGPVDLQQIAAHAASVRSGPSQRMIDAYTAWKQAEFDLQSVRS